MSDVQPGQSALLLHPGGAGGPHQMGPGHHRGQGGLGDRYPDVLSGFSKLVLLGGIQVKVNLHQYFSSEFLKFSDIEVEGDWRNYYTNDKAVLNLGQKTTTNSNSNCGVQGPEFMGWREFVCFEPIMLTCVCEHPQQMYLKLRGLCPGSHIDRFFVPRNGFHHKQFDFYSLLCSDLITFCF